MHVNYEYLLDFITRCNGKGQRALDYGCGKAEVVQAARAKGLEVYGADVFFRGGSRKADVERLGYLGTIVKEIKDNRIDFPDAYFDVVVNNQVMEHVENLDTVLKEIHRVLKPGGKILSLFPSKEVWWEGHCGVLFPHRFSNPNARMYVLLFFRCMGLGQYTSGKTRMEWSRHFAEYIGQHTHYRSFREIVASYERYFTRLDFLEHKYADYRLEHSHKSLLPLYRSLSTISLFRMFVTLFVRKRGGLVFSCTKRSS